MKKIEKAFKKIFGINEPSKIFMDIPSLYPKTMFSVDETQAVADQARMHRLMMNSTFGLSSAKISDKEKDTSKEEKEEWIWINGYKGTDKDMKCRDFQYELNKQFDMPEDEEVSLCSSGFHLCRDLDDVFDYYAAEDGNRYFHVRALVRKTDFEHYGMRPSLGYLYWSFGNDNKIAAKSIEFLSEVSRDELEHALIEHYKDSFIELPKEYRARVPEMSIAEATKLVGIDKLVAVGYSKDIAKYIAKYNRVSKAIEVAELTELSIDTKMVLIFS